MTPFLLIILSLLVSISSYGKETIPIYNLVLGEKSQFFNYSAYKKIIIENENIISLLQEPTFPYRYKFLSKNTGETLVTIIYNPKSPVHVQTFFNFKIKVVQDKDLIPKIIKKRIVLNVGDILDSYFPNLPGHGRRYPSKTPLDNIYYKDKSKWLLTAVKPGKTKVEIINPIGRKTHIFEFDILAKPKRSTHYGKEHQ